MRGFLAVFLAFLALFVIAGRVDARSIVLAFHAGGFDRGSTASIEPHVRLLRSSGLRVRNVRYPLGNLPRAVRYTERLARRYRRRGYRVLSYGESAGGYLSAWLSIHRLSRSVAVAPPEEFLTWSLPVWAGGAGWYQRIGLGTESKRRQYSLLWNVYGSARLTIFHGRFDGIVPIQYSREFAQNVEGVRLIEMPKLAHGINDPYVRQAARILRSYR